MSRARKRLTIEMHELVEIKPSFRERWQAGYVEEVGEHHYKVRACFTSRLHTIQLAGPQRQGKIRRIHGPRVFSVVSRLEARALPAQSVDVSTLPMIRVVSTVRPALRALPKPRGAYRDEEYLVFVRTWRCCGCDLQRTATEAHHIGHADIISKCDDYFTAPCCADCHTLVTWGDPFPGCTWEETVARLAEVSRLLLIEWAARCMRQTAVPVLRMVAA